MRTRTGLTLLVLLLFAVTGVSAQPVPPRGTLLEWGAGLRRLILDRTHGYGGRYYEGGLFRTFTRQMDYEYELDLLTYRFTLFDDPVWVQAAGGYRSIPEASTTANSLPKARSNTPFAWAGAARFTYSVCRRKTCAPVAFSSKWATATG